MLLELLSSQDDGVGDVEGLLLVELEELKSGLVLRVDVRFLHDQLQVVQVQVEGLVGPVDVCMVLDQ